MPGRTSMVREAEARWLLVVMGPKLAAIRQRLAVRAGAHVGTGGSRGGLKYADQGLSEQEPRHGGLTGRARL